MNKKTILLILLILLGFIYFQNMIKPKPKVEAPAPVGEVASPEAVIEQPIKIIDIPREEEPVAASHPVEKKEEKKEDLNAVYEAPLPSQILIQ